MRTRTFLPALLLVAVAACSSAGEQVEDKIDERVGQVLEIGDLDTTCPDDAEAGAGNEFTCTVPVEGQTLEANVVFSDDSHFDVTFNGDVFDTDTLESGLGSQAEEQTGLVIDFDCPGDANTVIPADDTIECPGEADDGTTGVVEVGLDEDGAPEIVDLRGDE